MRKYLLDVTVSKMIVVEVDETAFTPEFLERFNLRHWKVDGMEGHICQLAGMHAEDIIDPTLESAYGSLQAMGISTHQLERLVTISRPIRMRMRSDDSDDCDLEDSVNE